MGVLNAFSTGAISGANLAENLRQGQWSRDRMDGRDAEADRITSRNEDIQDKTREAVKLQTALRAAVAQNGGRDLSEQQYAQFVNDNHQSIGLLAGSDSDFNNMLKMGNHVDQENPYAGLVQNKDGTFALMVNTADGPKPFSRDRGTNDPVLAFKASQIVQQTINSASGYGMKDERTQAAALEMAGREQAQPGTGSQVQPSLSQAQGAQQPGTPPPGSQVAGERSRIDQILQGTTPEQQVAKYNDVLKEQQFLESEIAKMNKMQNGSLYQSNTDKATRAEHDARLKDLQTKHKFNSDLGVAIQTAQPEATDQVRAQYAQKNDPRNKRIADLEKGIAQTEQDIKDTDNTPEFNQVGLKADLAARKAALQKEKLTPSKMKTPERIQKYAPDIPPVKTPEEAKQATTTVTSRKASARQRAYAAVQLFNQGMITKESLARVGAGKPLVAADVTQMDPTKDTYVNGKLVKEGRANPKDYLESQMKMDKHLNEEDTKAFEEHRAANPEYYKDRDSSLPMPTTTDMNARFAESAAPLAAAGLPLEKLAGDRYVRNQFRQAYLDGVKNDSEEGWFSSEKRVKFFRMLEQRYNNGKQFERTLSTGKKAVFNSETAQWEAK